MDWDDLRLFLATARSGRMISAAKIVGQNATTVSRRLQRLERELQVTLFEQTAAGYALTERGAALLPRAEAMEEAALSIQEAANGVHGALTGTIRISVSEGFGSRILAPRLQSFTSDHPCVGVDLIASTGFLNPSRREADIAIMLARPKRGPLIVRKLTDYQLGLYGSRDYFLHSPRLAVPEDLLEHRLVGYVPDLIYAPELRYLAEVDPRLEATIRSSSINAQAELIAAGAGCGILPCFIGETEKSMIRLLPQEISIRRTFWLVIHREVRRIARVDRFVAWLDQAIAETQLLMLGFTRSPERDWTT